MLPDHLRIHSEWMATGKSHAGIIFWAVGLPIGKVIRGILKVCTDTTPEAAVNLLKFL